MTRKPEQFIDEIKSLHPTIEVLGIYQRAVDPVLVRCMVCGKEWAPKAYSLLQGKGCPHCSAIAGAKKNRGKTGLKTHEDFVSQLESINKNIKIIGEYQSTHQNIDCECRLCNHRWEAKPYSLLQGHGCPRCSKSGTSFMEQLIYFSLCDVLGNKEVLSRDKKLIGMELDIVVPRFKIAIEPGNWFLHCSSFERDKEKRKRCEEKGYRLITVYDKYPENENVPFDSDCYVYTEDLNKTDHTVIRELIFGIIAQMGIDYKTIHLNWDRLEKKAYDNSKAKTHNDFINELRQINPTIIVLGNYVNANRGIPVKCEICGYEWEGVPASLLAGDGCRKCGVKTAHKPFIKKQMDFVEEVERVNPNVEIIGTYEGRHKPIKVRCRICGYEWMPIASSILRGSNHKGAKGMHNILFP